VLEEGRERDGESARGIERVRVRVIEKREREGYRGREGERGRVGERD
jgi:hypothetical protein